MNYKQLLNQNDIKESELTEFSPKSIDYIEYYKRECVKLESIKRSKLKSMWDKENSCYTPTSLKNQADCRKKIGMYNDLISDEIALLLDKKESLQISESEKSIELNKDDESQIVLPDSDNNNKRKGFLGLF